MQNEFPDLSFSNYSYFYDTLAWQSHQKMWFLRCTALIGWWVLNKNFPFQRIREKETKLWSRHQREHTSSWNIKLEFGFPSWSVTIRVCIPPRSPSGHPDEELIQTMFAAYNSKEGQLHWVILNFLSLHLKSGAPWRKQGRRISLFWGRQLCCCWTVTWQESKSFRIRVRNNTQGQGQEQQHRPVTFLIS